MMETFLSRRAVFLLAFFLCMGLVPFFTFVRSFYDGPMHPRLTVSQLADLYNKNVPTARAPVEMGLR